MTLAALPQPMRLFDPQHQSTGYSTTLTIDAASEKAAAIFRVPRTGNIDRVGWRTAAITTGWVADVRLETLDATGLPSGSLVGTTTNAAHIIADADDATYMEDTLTLPAAVTVDQLVALVITQPAVAAGNGVITCVSNNMGAFGYCAHFTAAWAKPSGFIGVGHVRYDNGLYYPVDGLLPYSSSVNNSFSDSSGNDERGNKITVPFACKVIGAWYAASNATGDWDLKLYDDANALLVSRSVDGDISNYAGVTRLGYVYFASEVQLRAGQVVRLTKRPTTATNSVEHVIGCSSAGLMAAMPGGGAMVKTQRNNNGAFSEPVATEVSMIGLLVSAVDKGDRAAQSMVVGAGARGTAW